MTGQEAVNVATCLPGARRVRRRGPHEARRRRTRRRRALRQGGHGAAGEARLGRREARPARVLPPRPHGLADPRHGRRAHAHREGRGCRRRGRPGGDGEAHSRGRVHLRRLPRELPDDAQDGAAAGRSEARPGHRQAAPGRRSRREAARAGRGDRPLDDPAGAPHAARHLDPAAPADRCGERDVARRGEQAHGRPQADGEDDEADGQGKDADAPAGCLRRDRR